jgi:acyl-CoA synthetase (AMP-forming)/AMP-acid ligase II
MAGEHAKLTIPALLRRLVAERGQHEAVAMTHDRVTYAELDRRSGRLARALLARGIGKGSRVALQLPDGILAVTALLGATRVGALVSLVSTLVKPPELAHIIRNSDCQLFIGARRFLRNDYAETLTAALPGVSRCAAGKLCLIEAPYLRSIWLDDAEGLSWAGSIEQLLAAADDSDAPDEALLAAVESEVVPSDDAVVVYTSGSTSLPKAVVHPQSTVIRKSAALADIFGLEPGDRMMPLLPAFWIGGLAMAFMTMGKGGTLVYPAGPSMDVIADTIRQLNVNKVNSWGPQHSRVVKSVIDAGVDVDKIWGLSPMRDRAGEPIPAERVPNQLGMSESFSAHSGQSFQVALPADKPWSSALPIDDMERRIVDPETGVPVPRGQTGELQIRGPALMSGFYKIDRAETFTPDGFYPTNDLVWEDEDGFLFFVARQGDMLKTNGANVSRLEVEAALNAQPGVDISIVFGLKDADIGQRVVAAVVPAEGAQLGEGELNDALRSALSNFKVPKDIVFIASEDIQWATAGKLKRNAMEPMIAELVQQKHLREQRTDAAAS